LVALTIAGVDLLVQCDPTSPSSHEAAYESFLLPQGRPYDGHSVIDISVMAGPAPANVSPIVFDSGGVWTMQVEGAGYRLGFHREGSHACHTIACADADTTRVRVYVDQDEALVRIQAASPSGRRLSPVRYPLDQLLLMNHLAKLGGIIIHGAGAVLGGKAIVLAGASGAGKSTISRLFMDAGLGDSILSDDRVVIRTTGGQDALPEVTAWGTPWPGDARVARNAMAPLSALLFLVKSEVNELRALPANVAAKRLMPVVTCPWYDPKRLPHVLDACSRVVERTRCYEFCFRPDAGAVELAAGTALADNEASR
jgi:hypothetical protein